ncbi:MAG: sugar phosphate isomerase/epimerase and 4-hydroxyphenylpyruvate domain-containing protein [Meiothermus sp.]|uniref:bifunctional sugar phosphate isomerase/epimerase/4-hydroxyphenylpyruvate dioxygenase family protein n=1 Tax=Meiothermus sp. TaxID=1955249 RepID=UPI0025D2A9A8|nr:sugar phosphate isomerase/epimerase and 4-hydroxyphenylpyruvate domain-containing protein [Meiothermus sp.]MCS7067115.1 sugar phosphate isomerase/epimerase and 4-hydroxyphenylpyruvate domain-containing protein [Meiothermus sp.]MCX7601474.1 sugar phosphate isomerase/epimerase and 4-hydroxyphenylpyruvate domain-containing protein [Meiothermus sp.]
MYRTSIATVSLSGDLKSKLRAIAQAGFEGVELFEQDLLTFEGLPSEVGAFIRELGLRLVALQPFRDFEGLPEPERSRAFERAERKFDLMEALGTDLLLVCSNVSPKALPGLDRAAEDLYELGERARQRGMRVGFEALAWGKHIQDYRDAWEVVRRANHPAVGTILDSFHILAQGLPLSAIPRIPPEKIFLVQVADAPRLEMGLLPWSRHFRSLPGQGQLPLTAFMQALGEARYEGFISLEVFNDQFRAAPPHEVAQDAHRSLIYLHELAHPENLPPVPQSLGVGFVEFAVNEGEAAQLEDLLARLGFVCTHHHPNRQIHLWQQGQIRFVVNSDPEGFAHNYQLLHGATVCALGLEVSSLPQTLERAQAYRLPVLEPSDWPLPALEGLEGSLLYLMEPGNTWLEGLTPVASAPTHPLLGRIDHIAQVMPPAKLLTWRLFYRSVLGLEASDLTEIPDPKGLIESQAMQNPERTLRLVLNASQHTETLASRFLNAYYGGGVQHIALETQDIFATLAAFKQAGVEMLPIPQTYYLDLEARYGLEEELLRALKQYSILYEQTEQGEFFQAYTKTFADLFFFEVVQRRNYDGFGASNASARIAAQLQQRA